MKIVQLPRKVWIRLYEFSLRTVPIADPNLQTEEGVASHGMCITDEGALGVWIADNLSPRQRLVTVLHELTHALNWVLDIDDGVDEEVIADKHGEAWAQFYLDNPRFQPWLAYTIGRIRHEQKTGDDGTLPEKPKGTDGDHANT